MTELEQDPQVQEVTSTGAAVIAQVRGMKIVSTEGYEQGSSLLLRIKAALKSLEEARTRITAPLNASLREVNAQAKGKAAPLEEAERIIKRAMGDYQIEQERIAREQQRKLDEEAAKERTRLQEIADRAAASGQETKAERFAERAATVVAPVVQAVAPKVAGIKTRDVARYKIVNAALLPREYLMADEKKIGAIVRALKTEANIAGVEVWLEKEIAAGAA